MGNKQQGAGVACYNTYDLQGTADRCVVLNNHRRAIPGYLTCFAGSDGRMSCVAIRVLCEQPKGPSTRKIEQSEVDDPVSDTLKRNSDIVIC